MDDPNMHAYGEDGPTDAEIGRQWREDSSLERWFPITAERLAAKEKENLHLAREARTWWEAAQTYAADAERLRAVLRKIEAGEYLHLPTMVREALGPNVGGEARLAAHQPPQTTTATPQGVASTDQLGGRDRSEKDRA